MRNLFISKFLINYRLIISDSNESNIFKFFYFCRQLIKKNAWNQIVTGLSFGSYEFGLSGLAKSSSIELFLVHPSIDDSHY
jgi:hypothetical protein